MSPELANFLFEAANFLVLAAALGWVLFKPVRRALAAEQERHAAGHKDLERQLESLEQQRSQLAEEQKAFSAQLEGDRTDALERARTAALDRREQARNEIVAEREAFRRELEARKRAELDSLVEDVSQLAAGTVERLMGKLAGPALDLSLVRAVVDELDGVTGEVTVESAKVLGRDARAHLDAALPGGYKIRVRPELGAGLRIASAAGQVDVSALAFAREARRMLPFELELGREDD